MELRSNEEKLDSVWRLYESLFVHSSSLPLPPLPPPPPRIATQQQDSNDKDDNNNGNDDDKGEAAMEVPRVAVVVEQRTAAEIVRELEFVLSQLEDIPVDKFQKRLEQKDPITKQPRYGTKTAQRVEALIRQHQELLQVVHVAFGRNHDDHDDDKNNGETNNINISSNGPPVAVVDQIRELATQEAEEEQRRQEEERRQILEAEEARKNAEAEIRRQQEEAVAQQRQRELDAQNELRRQAEEARREAQFAQEAAARADREWINSIPHRKTLQGVEMQLKVFSQQTDMDGLTALHTLFSQIVAHPEEVNYRRIRRDHPRFLQDIGQYEGGKEVLIAAGFELGFVEEVPSFVCKEPNVEKDLDGWTAWFDLLKNAVELIEQEMLK